MRTTNSPQNNPISLGAGWAHTDSPRPKDRSSPGWRILPALGMQVILAVVFLVARSAVAGEEAGWWQPAPDACPGLYAWSDTCNVYALAADDAALLIDTGDGSAIEALDEIGVERIAWVVFTHHHREQCQGFPVLADDAVKTAAPSAERALLEKPTDYRRMIPSLGDPFTVYGASYVRPPIEPIPISRSLEAGETLSWSGYELRCVETPGNSPGAMTYILDAGGRRVAFSGDVVCDGPRMHTWFDTEWDYGFGKGLETLIESVDRLAEQSPDVLLPSHGPVISNPLEQLSEYGQKLRKLQSLYVRGYPVFEITDEEKDPLSRPTAVPGIGQVLPHLFKFTMPGFGGNFSIIIADSGRAIVSDCGLMSAEVLDRALEGMREHLGLKQIDAMVISHMHGDHFLLGEHLRRKYGAEIWTLDRVADLCEHPQRYDYAAMIQAYNADIDSLTIDRRLQDGEVVEWEGYRLQFDWMPGQTEFGCCMWLALDGRRVAFTGDNIFGNPRDPQQDGHEAVVARNSAVFEEGYLYAAEYLQELQPDLMMGGHSFVMPEPKEFIDRYHRWAQEIIRVYQELLGNPYYQYRFDPYWVKAEPYRVILSPGATQQVDLVVRNFREGEQRHRIAIATPPGIVADPPVLEGVLKGHSRQSFPVQLRAEPGAEPGLRIVGFDITLDGRRYGQWFDMLVDIAAENSRE